MASRGINPTTSWCTSVLDHSAMLPLMWKRYTRNLFILMSCSTRFFVKTIQNKTEKPFSLHGSAKSDNSFLNFKWWDMILDKFLTNCNKFWQILKPKFHNVDLIWHHFTNYDLSWSISITFDLNLTSFDQFWQVSTNFDKFWPFLIILINN